MTPSLSTEYVDGSAVADGCKAPFSRAQVRVSCLAVPGLDSKRNPVSQGPFEEPASYQRLEPTGHPPTPTDFDVVQFKGTLEELAQLTLSVLPGTVIDLGGDDICSQSEGEQSVDKTASTRSSSDFSGTLSCGCVLPTAEMAEVSPGTSLALPRSHSIDLPRGSLDVLATNGAALTQLAQRALAGSSGGAGTPDVSGGTADPTGSRTASYYNQTSMPFGERTSSAVSIATTLGPISCSMASLATPSFSAMHSATTCAFLGIESAYLQQVHGHAGSSGASVTVLGADAAVRSRHKVKSPSEKFSDTLRRSCVFDPKRLKDRLDPEGQAPSAPAFVFGSAVSKLITLRSGTLRLPEQTVLLLRDADITFQNVAISGAGANGADGQSLPLVYVSSGRTLTMSGGSLSGCIHGHGLAIAPDAIVKLTGVEVSGHATYGAVIRGEGASLIARDCVFSRNGHDGVAVALGARAKLEGCELSANGMLGLAVFGAGSAADVAECALISNCSHGVAASGGARCALTVCRAENNRIGVVALDVGTTMTLSTCVLSDNEHGLHARAGAIVDAQRTRIVQNQDGVQLYDSGTQAVFTGCDISRAAVTGLTVSSGAVAFLTECTLSNNGGHGVAVQHARSRAELSDVSTSKNGAAGVHVSVAGSVEAVVCKLSGNRVSGAQATDQGSSLLLQRCALCKNSTIGAFVNKGASAQLADCRIEGNGSSGVEARDRHTRVTAERCALASNGRVGAYSHSAARLEVRGGRVAANGAFALLAGGRTNTDIGGGCIAYSPSTALDGGTMVRHGGRIFTEPLECGSSEDEDGGGGNVDGLAGATDLAEEATTVEE